MVAEPSRPATIGTRIDTFTDLLGRWMSWLVLAIVLLMACNVLMRYLFDTGSVWAQDLEWHLLVPVVLVGMTYTLRHGEHVRSDILYFRFAPRTRAVIDLVSALLIIAIALLILWFSLHYVQQSFVIDEKSPDPGGLPHRWIIKGMMPIGFALLALQGVACALAALDRLRGAGRAH
jgi:TRAP-type mannitol/chloroaromatic compound transport system permease small subunit